MSEELRASVEDYIGPLTAYTVPPTYSQGWGQIQFIDNQIYGQRTSMDYQQDQQNAGDGYAQVRIAGTSGHYANYSSQSNGYAERDSAFHMHSAAELSQQAQQAFVPPSNSYPHSSSEHSLPSLSMYAGGPQLHQSAATHQSSYPAVPQASHDAGRQLRPQRSVRMSSTARNTNRDWSRPPASTGVAYAYVEQAAFHGQQPPGYTPRGLPVSTSSKVVHMKRLEAWTKFLAYEGCIQVCMHFFDQEHAKHFLGMSFAKLKHDFGIEDLLLSAAQSQATNGVSPANDICWDDLELGDRQLAAVGLTHAFSFLQINKRGFRNVTYSSLRVVGSILGDMVGQLDCKLDKQGTALLHHPLVLSTEQQIGSLRVDVMRPDGILVASGSISCTELHKAAKNAASLTVHVHGVQEHLGRQGWVMLLLQVQKKHVQDFEFADITGKPQQNVNTNTLRVNGCLAYDFALEAALRAEGCCRTKLKVEGPWNWLLARFAEHFGVSGFYCILAHLRWVLKPSVACVSSRCFDVINDSMQPLLQHSHTSSLSQQEQTMLHAVQSGAELLLQMAFEHYFHLQDEVEMQDNTSEVGRMWQPTALKAACRLFRTMKDVFVPSDQDWLNARFRTAARSRWGILYTNQQADELAKLNAAEVDASNKLRNRFQFELHQHERPPANAGNTNQHDSSYKRLERIALAMKTDLEFDIALQQMADLLPSSLDLPRITAEEYCAQFLKLLRDVLQTKPPQNPSVAAVDLLVACAKLQKYLQERNLMMDARHPGYLDALELWRPHVLSWINMTRASLCDQCDKLKAGASLSVSHLARIEADKMPGMIEGIEGAVAPLVRTMMEGMWAQLKLYERVIMNWPIFGPHLEFAMCKVLRSVLLALMQLCQGANNAPISMAGPAAYSPGMGVPVNGAYSPGMPPASMHTRMPSHTVLGGPPSMMPPGMSGVHHGHTASAPPMAMVTPRVGPYGQWSPAGMPSGSPQQGSGPRIFILVKEAVLLNSLKCLMVMVPSLEDCISKWCGGNSVVPPGAPQPNSHDPVFEDLAPHIGAQFAQVVKELRSEYTAAVASCAGRLADTLRSTPQTSIRAALEAQKPPADPHAYPQVSTMTQQKEWVERLMQPVTKGCGDCLAALRSTLDPRVYVAVGRALWDAVGKDLYDFVNTLQEGEKKAAWRARQHASLALCQLNDFYRQRLADSMQHTLSDKDLYAPTHVERAHNLLAQSSAAVNMAFTPI